MKIIKRVLLFIIILIFSTFLFLPSIYAHTLEDFYTDSDAGWNLKNGNPHMGDDETTYNYSPTSIKTTYQTAIEDGADLWGSNISMSEVSSGNMGTIYAVDLPDEDIAKADTSWNSTTKHMTSWSITIDPERFDDEGDDAKTDEDRAKIIAHEIGHVYGLAHVMDEDHIMYPSFVGNDIHNDEVWGMKVCTHYHYYHSWSYYPYDEDHHKKKCDSCKGYYLEDHSFTPEWLPIGTEDVCKKLINRCTECDYSYDLEFDNEHMFTTSEWVPVGTADICQKMVETCGDCGYSEDVEFDTDHDWTDENDYSCNDCGYIRPMEAYEEGGLYKINLDGQVWILNDDTDFEELDGYSTSCILPTGGTLEWDMFTLGGSNVYCFKYDDTRYWTWTEWGVLKDLTKVRQPEYSSRYYYLNRLHYFGWSQGYQTLDDLTGIFFLAYHGNEQIGYWAYLYRALVDETSGEMYKNTSVYYKFKIPLYFSE